MRLRLRYLLRARQPGAPTGVERRPGGGKIERPLQLRFRRIGCESHSGEGVDRVN